MNTDRRQEYRHRENRAEQLAGFFHATDPQAERVQMMDRLTEWLADLHKEQQETNA